VADSPDVSLYNYGVPLYDNLLLFAPTTEQLSGGLDAAGVSAFVERVRARACVREWAEVSLVCVDLLRIDLWCASPPPFPPHTPSFNRTMRGRRAET
jgi:hypothetical protein